jgi:hydrogenase expression/formation protein HypE
LQTYFIDVWYNRKRNFIKYWGGKMKVGKLTVDDLRELIFKNLKSTRKEVLSNPEIGGDCAIVDSKDKVIYLSSDPITGTSKGIGKLSVNINCNDIATAGVEPLGLMVTILAPEGTKREEIEEIAKEIQEECDKLNVDVLGGHTEITSAVNKIIISATAIGLGEKEEIKIKERTGIIAYEKEEELKERFGPELLEKAKKFLEKTSVVREGLIGKKYAKGMHDVTEGGILGAVWEMGEFYGLGVELIEENLIVGEETLKIAQHFNIDPLRLISSGTMLMIYPKEARESIVEELKRKGIESFIIGKFISGDEKYILGKNGKTWIAPPESDELYKVL